MSIKNDLDDFEPLELAALDISGDDDQPVVVFTDDDGKKVTKCYAATKEPITVIMHEYGTCKRWSTSDTNDSLSFLICNFLSSFSLDFTPKFDSIRKNSSAVNELMSRTDDLKSAVQFDNQTCSCARNSRCTIWIIQTVVNFLLGILLMTFLLVYGHSASSQLLHYMQTGVNSMILLLDWLMGVPAGLKLNYNLTAFLGRFFMYHIWLWAEYLKLAGKHFDVIFITISALGLLGGASLQVALLQDTFKIFLLHMYCFYIYTSRLYSLMHYSLLSLWRLFRGLKWNLLRERVDHASYDSTQLFIGTLLFAILLFILPTVFLYYLVFATLSAVIVGLHMSLDRLRYLLTHTYTLVCEPLMGFLYNLCDKEDYGLSVQPSSGYNITVLTMRHRRSFACPNCRL